MRDIFTFNPARLFSIDPWSSIKWSKNIGFRLYFNRLKKEKERRISMVIVIYEKKEFSLLWYWTRNNRSSINIYIFFFQLINCILSPLFPQNISFIYRDCKICESAISSFVMFLIISERSFFNQTILFPPEISRNRHQRLYIFSLNQNNNIRSV